MALAFFLRESIYLHRENDILFAGSIIGTTQVERQPPEAGLIELSTNSAVGGTIILIGELANVSQNETFLLGIAGRTVSAKKYDEINSIAVTGFTGKDVGYIRSRTTGMQPLTQRYQVTSFLGQISQPRGDLGTFVPGAQDMGKAILYHTYAGICSGDLVLRQSEWFVVQGRPYPVIDFDGEVMYYKTFLERE